MEATTIRPMLRTALRWLGKNWGLAIFIVDIVASLGMIATHPPTGHYINYTAPARALWRGEDPYGITFPGSPGAFFYSPGCALYFYGLFTLFPDRLGQLLYMVLSVAVFGFAIVSLLKTLKEKGWDLQSLPYRHLFWLMAGSEMVGGIVAVKIDVLIGGVVLWLVSCVLRGRREIAACFILGLLTSFKLHPVLIFGLMMAALTTHSFARVALLCSAFGAGIVFGLISPFVALPSDFAEGVTRHWSSEIDRFVSVAWMDDIFQHIYGFLGRAFNFRVPLSIANQITAVVGVATAAMVFWFGRKVSKETGLIVGAGIGSGFVVVFSQLIQSNSYIIYFPLVLSFLWVATDLKWSKRTVYPLLITAYLLISIFYSDLTPRPLYHILYQWGVKPLGVILLGVATLIGYKKMAARDQLSRAA